MSLELHQTKYTHTDHDKASDVCVRRRSGLVSAVLRVKDQRL